jgi:RNase P protein component
VERNFFRRKFYALVENYIFLEDVSNEKKNTGFDMVFVVKKKTKLDKKNESLIKDFRNDINFLFNKVLNP